MFLFVFFLFFFHCGHKQNRKINKKMGSAAAAAAHAFKFPFSFCTYLVHLLRFFIRFFFYLFSHQKYIHTHTNNTRNKNKIHLANRTVQIFQKKNAKTDGIQQNWRKKKLPSFNEKRIISTVSIYASDVKRIRTFYIFLALINKYNKWNADIKWAENLLQW